jgi:RNA polymerase sigma-70 factor (ECF subfamily)
LRVAADRRRSLAARPETELDAELPVADIPPDELVALHRARALLDEALDCLSDDQRAVFVLVEMEELTGPETAAALDIPPGTVASRLRAARGAFDAAVRRLRLRGKEKR